MLPQCSCQSSASQSPTSRRGQWTLIGMLVSLAVIVIISAWYYKSILKPQAGSHNGAPAAEQQAYGAVCSTYQSQLTQAVMMYKSDHNDRPPQNFEQLKKYGATDDLTHATGCQFQLDPATGAITEIGHGRAAPNAAPVVLGGGVSGAPAPRSGYGVPGPGGVTLPPNAGGSLPQIVAEMRDSRNH